MAPQNKIKTSRQVKKDKNALKLSFSYIYLLLAALFLAVTTIFWAYLGADLHFQNADQLIISYLFNDVGSLNNALLPSAHSFLFKWPLFYAVNFFAPVDRGFILMTLASAVLTVGGMAWLLYKIEKRPIVLGTVYLCFASILIMIPTVPASGQLLPVNMAMLATRNLEYLLYILCLWFFVRSKSPKQHTYWLGVLILAILIISDRLFMSLSLGGALLAYGLYFVNSKIPELKMSWLWLAGSTAASLLAAILTVLINLSGLSNLVSAGQLGPYGFIDSGYELTTGLIYSIIHILTNFGANPALHTSVIADIPASFIKGLFNSKGPAYLLNILILITTVAMAVKLSLKFFKRNKRKKNNLDPYTLLSFYLICSAVAAIGAFIISKHYYAADARYLAIVLFAVLIAGTVYSRSINWREPRLAVTGVFIAGAAIMATPGVYKDYQKDKAALSAISARNERIIEALSHHKVDVLVGDYWRVIPIKTAADSAISVLPLQDCTTARNVLSREDWRVDLSNHSFAYLLSYDDSLTDYPNCNPADIVSRYGSPNSSILLDGTFSQPLEQLLIYDNGARKKYPLTSVKTKGVETIRPALLSELPKYSCPQGVVMNIVAHQDDDLLFMNPDLALAISGGLCVRTVYVTAGDAGSNMYYWLNRQQGTQAAYSKMLGAKTEWADRNVNLGKNKYVVVANPLGNANVSLVFMYIPDGNLKGQGFAGKKTSLSHLNSSQITTIEAVYTGTRYTQAELIDSLIKLIDHYSPSEIRTHSMQAISDAADHSDHISVGQLAKLAYDAYKAQKPDAPIGLAFYQGYQVQLSPPNVNGDNLTIKEAAFMEYAKLDRGVCRSLAQCQKDPAYGAYLIRQYRVDN